ncbi:MAG: HAMP domain-containing histidine kinase [Gammaproteobacteria bacterium]|nr:HAMP domain-containing histidine kinase [Gammaproteobacteria bacterium]
MGKTPRAADAGCAARLARLRQAYARRLRRAREAQRRAEATARACQRALAIVSHELRSPLSGIESWTHVLERQVDGGHPVVRRALDGIRAGVGRQARLIDDLLEASRAIAGRLRVAPRPLRPIPILVEVLQSLRAAARAKRIALTAEYALGGARVAADPDRLHQILWNLLSNAIRYTPAGGRVAVSVRCEDGRVAIAVRDNGRGIRAEFLPHVFDWFRCADATEPAAPGLGLGLALVRRLCELQGGTVAAASAGENRGAVFTVRLPLAPDGCAGVRWAGGHGPGERAGARLACPPP